MAHDMQTVSGQTGSGFTRAREIWGRRKWLGLTVFTAVLAVSLGIVAALPPMFRSRATVLVDREQVPEAFVRSAVSAEVETRIQRISQEVLSRERLAGLIERGPRAMSHEKREPVRRRERIRVACVVVMLVREDDSAQRRGRNAQALEPSLELLGRKPAVEQQPGRARLDDHAVSLGAAAGAGEPNAAFLLQLLVQQGQDATRGG